VLIFLAGLAFLLMLFALAKRVAPRQASYLRPDGHRELGTPAPPR
jgi:hypothetical protein